ncbi:hypothetical protein TRP8649_04426 [Pelagimonas phthalicica]|uniref:Uncharacterized protein n=1 Tax=Pelagimonas phthalicica TaxID=1037362 RepID=A0A238JIR5_9RHOB|nr:hypothetical protein CLV87_4172 [Pelagimonas phthalicica]SMX30283.1 hypothetical protein TRP8649_04426 [Pelagimonas phthalicica]
MSIRVFHCKSCGHHMRLFGGRCGYCRDRKLLHQRVISYVLAVLIMAAAGIYVWVVTQSDNQIAAPEHQTETVTLFDIVHETLKLN